MLLHIERTFNSRINPDSIVPTFFSDTMYNAKWRILMDAGVGGGGGGGGLHLNVLQVGGEWGVHLNVLQSEIGNKLVVTVTAEFKNNNS